MSHEAIQTAAALGDAFAAALQDAHAETAALARLDHAAVLEVTVRRERFNTESKDLLRQLQTAMGSQTSAQVPGLAEKLDQLQDLGRKLAQQDVENRRLAERALKFTTAVSNSLRPKTHTYDRRGRFSTSRPDAGTASSISHRT